MKVLCGTILAAVAAFKVVYAIDCADVSVADFPRLAGESGDSSRIMRAIEKAGGGGVVWFPRGEYEIDSMLVITNGVSLLFHKSAHLKAVCEMPFVFQYYAHLVEGGNASGFVDHNLFIRGGDIDGAGLAGCAQIMGVRHFTLADTTFRNGKGVGLQFGDPELPRNVAGGYEIVANNLYFICNIPGLAGNIAFLTYIGDSHFTDIVIVDYTTGIRDMTWSNRFTRCHVWGGIVKKAGTTEPEMLEIEYFGPWVTEVSDPWNTCLRRQSASYQMHGLRRSRADDQIYGMLLQVVLQESHRRPDPQTARIRTEKIAAYPHRHLLQEGLVLRIHRIDLHSLLAVAGPAQHLLVQLIRLDDPPLDHLRRCRHLRFQRSVDRQLLRILRRIDHRLPSLRRQILGELHPPLHPRTSGRWPVVRYYQHPFHKDTKIDKLCEKRLSALKYLLLSILKVYAC